MLRRSLAVALTLAALTAVAGCGDSGDGGDAAPAPAADARGDNGRAVSGGEPIGPAGEGLDGVIAFEIDSNTHTEQLLDYQHSPPVGGEHFPVPATCGFYDSDVPPDELIVHSLEHGAIWFAYDPTLDATQLGPLRELVAQQAKVMATPLEGLEAPIVVSAWARQMPIEAVDDPRVAEFVAAYRNGPTAPEPGAPCQGEGDPAVASPTA